MPALSQAEVWLEVRTGDTGAAAATLEAAGVARCDAIEPLPADLHAFWIVSPDGTVHLVDGTAPAKRPASEEGGRPARGSRPSVSRRSRAP